MIPTTPSQAQAQAGTDLSIQIEQLMANELALALKTITFRWHAQGPIAASLREELAKIVQHTLAAIDMLGERNCMRGKAALLNGRRLSLLQVLEDAGEPLPTAEGIVWHLALDLDALAGLARGAAETAASQGDLGTQHELSGILAEHERQRWRLRTLYGTRG